MKNYFRSPGSILAAHIPGELSDECKSALNQIDQLERQNQTLIRQCEYLREQLQSRSTSRFLADNIDIAANFTSDQLNIRLSPARAVLVIDNSQHVGYARRRAAIDAVVNQLRDQLDRQMIDQLPTLRDLRYYEYDKPLPD